MIFYDYYADVPPEMVDAFVNESELGRLVTVSPEHRPHIGLYPFVYAGSTIELHFNRADEQIADLKAQPQCLFEVDDVLAVIPSHWVDPENAVMATAYHRTVVFECQASVSEDPTVLAEQQMTLLGQHQPEGRFRPVTAQESLYRGMLAQIAAVRLEVLNHRVKFKLGQNRSLEARANIVKELRRRGRPNDERAADALQWTMDREGP